MYQTCALVCNILLLAMLFVWWGHGTNPRTYLQKWFSLLLPHLTHTSCGNHIQISPSDQAAVPLLQKLALSIPQIADHDPVWLWNDKVCQTPHTLGATETCPTLTVTWLEFSQRLAFSTASAKITLSWSDPSGPMRHHPQESYLDFWSTFSTTACTVGRAKRNSFPFLTEGLPVLSNTAAAQQPSYTAAWRG